MNARLAALLLFPGCAWVTDDELNSYQEGCDCPDAGLIVYPDLDGDGFGDEDAATTCPEDDGYLTTGGDCDDGDADVHPGAEESCNGLDDDCDGETDDADAVDAWRWYQDSDADGHGDPDAWTMACSQPDGYVAVGDADDCDDDDAAVSPAADEICGDLKDNDCDGLPGDCRQEGSEPWATTLLRVHGATEGDGTGQAMSGGMDLSGDGVADLAVGANDWFGDGNGMVGIFVGPFDENENVDMVHATISLDGSTAAPGVGRSLAMVGDMDGGGEPWLAVGASPLAPNGTDSGAVYLLEGPLGNGVLELSSIAAVVLDFAGPGDALGSALSSGLDATGNGFPDLVVGAPGADDNAGEALFFEGPVSTYANRTTARGIIQGDARDDTMGSAVRLLPDLDGDGLADLAVAAPCGGDSNQGQVQLFLSPLDSSFDGSAAAETYVGEHMNDLLGRVASAGDVDADGRNDLLLAAPYGSDDQAGVVYLVLGATSMVSTVGSAWATIEGSVGGGNLGAGISGLEDFDADGHADLLLGAPRADTPSTDAGTCYLFYGSVRGSLVSANADLTLSGSGSNVRSGSVVAAAGDLNADGYSDALIGAPYGAKGEVGLLVGDGW